MRWDLAWVVAMKDLAELRTSRFAMATMIAFPLVLAVLVPVLTVLPLSIVDTSNDPLPIRLEVSSSIIGQNVTDISIANATIEGTEVTTGTISGSFVGNTTLAGVYVTDSVLWNVTATDSVIRRSNIHESDLDESAVLIGSVVVGAPNPLQEVFEAFTSLFLLLFLIIPVMVPTVTASYTIVGEKLSRSLEPLLASPLSDGELLAGKTLSIMIPTMAATWGAFAIFVAIVAVGPSLIPITAGFYVAVLLLSPLVAILSIAANVFISSRVTDVRAAQQLGGLLVFPVLVFFIGAMGGLFAFGIPSILGFAGLLAVADAAMLLLALKTFDREEILVRWK